MVSHLLDLSRIEAGVLRIDAQWQDLATVISDTIARLRPLLEAHAVTLDLPSDLPPLQFDAVAVGEVLTNLIENAARYTPPGTQIDVTARRLDAMVAVEVRDNGPGLSAEAQAHLFEPFGRGSRGRARSQGSGLGLAVAKGLVEAHHGAIEGANDPRGGACFRFTLPLSAPPSAVATDSTPPALDGSRAP
jgi:two-component system sensor histidine kinase KdpD